MPKNSQINWFFTYEADADETSCFEGVLYARRIIVVVQKDVLSIATYTEKEMNSLVEYLGEVIYILYDEQELVRNTGLSPVCICIPTTYGIINPIKVILLCYKGG